MVSNPYSLRSRTCTLVYQEKESFHSQRASGIVLLVAKLEELEKLSLFLNPAWRDFVAPRHREYIEDLLEDFKERRLSEPEDLFQQMCSLDVGPIVTREEDSLKKEVPNAIPAGLIEFF